MTSSSSSSLMSTVLELLWICSAYFWACGFDALPKHRRAHVLDAAPEFGVTSRQATMMGPASCWSCWTQCHDVQQLQQLNVARARVTLDMLLLRFLGMWLRFSRKTSMCSCLGRGARVWSHLAPGNDDGASKLLELLEAMSMT